MKRLMQAFVLLVSGLMAGTAFALAGMTVNPAVTAFVLFCAVLNCIIGGTGIVLLERIDRE